MPVPHSANLDSSASLGHARWTITNGPETFSAKVCSTPVVFTGVHGAPVVPCRILQKMITKEGRLSVKQGQGALEALRQSPDVMPDKDRLCFKLGATPNCEPVVGGTSANWRH